MKLSSLWKWLFRSDEDRKAFSDKASYNMAWKESHLSDDCPFVYVAPVYRNVSVAKKSGNQVVYICGLAVTANGRAVGYCQRKEVDEDGEETSRWWYSPMDMECKRKLWWALCVSCILDDKSKAAVEAALAKFESADK